MIGCGLWTIASGQPNLARVAVMIFGGLCVMAGPAMIEAILDTVHNESGIGGVRGRAGADDPVRPPWPFAVAAGSSAAMAACCAAGFAPLSRSRRWRLPAARRLRSATSAPTGCGSCFDRVEADGRTVRTKSGVLFTVAAVRGVSYDAKVLEAQWRCCCTSARSGRNRRR